MMLFKSMVPLALPLASAALLSACASYEQGPPFRLEAQKEDHQTSDFVDGRETIYSRVGNVEFSLSPMKSSYRTGDDLWLGVGILNDMRSPPQPCDLRPKSIEVQYLLDGGEEQVLRAHTSDEYNARERRNKYDAEMYTVLGLAHGLSQFGGAPPSLTASDLATHDDAIENRIAINSNHYLRRTTVYPGEKHFGRVYMGVIPNSVRKMRFSMLCLPTNGGRVRIDGFTYIVHEVEG